MPKQVQGLWPRLLFFLMIAAVIVTVIVQIARETNREDAFQPELSHTLVLDPGHGGFDGGAVSDDGTKESDLNLAIAVRARQIAELVGQQTVMTRENDSARTDFASYSEHEDLVHRSALVNDTPGAILLSIHQNDFPTGQPSGSQVLYASSDGSEVLGKLTHTNLIRLLDPENRRVAEPAPRSLYLTSHVTCPAVLVECGFMSNNFEVLKLCDDNYQRKISLILIGSLLQYLDTTEQT